jgi:hypothetical protein
MSESSATGFMEPVKSVVEQYELNKELTENPEGVPGMTRIYYLGSLATDPEVRVRFPALLHFLRSSRSRTGSTQPSEYK